MLPETILSEGRVGPLMANPICAILGPRQSGKTTLARQLASRRKSHYLEFKTNDAPRMTKSLLSALEDLHLDRAWIVYPGVETYAVHERVSVAPLERVLLEIIGLR